MYSESFIITREEMKAAAKELFETVEGGVWWPDLLEMAADVIQRHSIRKENKMTKRYLTYLWHRFVWHTPCAYTENIGANGLTQYQSDLCLYRHKKGTLTDQRLFDDLIISLRSLLCGLELTNEESKAAIDCILHVTRRPEEEG